MESFFTLWHIADFIIFGFQNCGNVSLCTHHGGWISVGVAGEAASVEMDTESSTGVCVAHYCVWRRKTTLTVKIICQQSWW